MLQRLRNREAAVSTRLPEQASEAAIQLSWHELEDENVSLAVSAAGNLLPRLVTRGYFACDWRSTRLMIYSGTGCFWPDGAQLHDPRLAPSATRNAPKIF